MAEDGKCGRARRLIDLRRYDAHTVVGWLEDDFHHFGITIVHDGERVIDVGSTAVRFPYTTCGGAVVPVRALIGAPLEPRASDIGKWLPMRLQCTHMFDLAGLVLAHAAAGRVHRRYEATVEDREIVAWYGDQRRMLGRGSALLRRDDAPVLAWEIDRQGIVGPDAWAGQSLQHGFRERTEAMDVDAAEQATVLRRTIMIAGGRTADRRTIAPPRGRSVDPVCHSFQPGQREHADWTLGSQRDYSASSAGMLARRDEVPGFPGLADPAHAADRAGTR